MTRPLSNSFIALAFWIISSTTYSQCYESGELVPNGTFENYSACPSQPNNWNTVDNWFRPLGTSPDFSNPFCYPSFQTVSTPLPSGNGCAHFLASYSNSIPNSGNECLANCLISPMIAGVSYTVTVQLAKNNSYPNPNSLSIGVWGVNNCADLLNGGAPYNMGCMTGIPAMIPLVAEYNLPVTTNWQLFTFTCTPSVDIYGIAIGGLCIGNPNPPLVIPSGGSYYMDDVSIYANITPLTISAGPDQIINCIDSNAILNSVAAHGYPNYAYTWSPATGLSDASSANPIATPQTTTLYTLSVTDSSGCVRTDSVLVIVDQNPPTIDAGPDIQLCLGDTIALNATGAPTLIWNNGAINDSLFAPFNSQTYTVTGVDTNGCSSTDQVDVVVDPLPILEAGNDETICLGDSVVLEILGSDTYTWNTGTINGNYFIAPLGITEAIVTATTVAGCSKTDTISITTVTPTIEAGDDQILCENDLVTVNAISSSNFTWNNSIQNNVPFYQDTGSVYYYATAVDLIGCTATDSVLVFVEAFPEVTFTADILEGCSPLTVTFTNTTPGNSANCLWEFGNYYAENNCGQVTVTFASPGLYDVGLNVISSNGCPSSMNLIDYIYVEANPIAAFTTTSYGPDIFHTEITMNNESAGATSYTWNFGDGSPESLLVNPSHLFPNEVATSYLIELVAYSPLLCSDTAYQYINIKDELVFYVPNSFTPNGDENNQIFLPVFTSGFDTQAYHLSIFNRWGEVIFESYNHEIGWDGHCQSGYCNDGIYTWTIDFKLSENGERQLKTGHVNLLK